VRELPQPPRVLVAAAGLVLLVTTVLAITGAFHTGITTDEPIHVMRLRNYFDTGWYALDWDYGGSGPGGEGTNTFVYAPVTMLLLHAWSVLWGVEGWHQVATTPHAYDVRHLGVVVIGLIGLAAVAAIGRVILRSWRWGLVAAAALATMPMWTGHEMFNVKDVPVATGYTLVTLGLACFVRTEPARLPVRVARALCLLAGLVLTLGTRPGMWSGLFGALVIAVAAILLSSSTRRHALLALTEVAGSCAAAAVALVAIYPNLFGSPVKAVTRSTENSSSFLSGQKSNHFYVPKHLVEEMPTLLLAFVFTGIVVALLVIVKHRRTDPVAAGRIALVGVQVAAMPVVAILLGSDLYHGLRQLLFAAPAAAVLASYGMAWWLEKPKRPRLVALAAAAALVLPAIDQVTIQPFQTTYVNLATDLVTGPFVGEEHRPGGDFWRVSIPELIDSVRLDRQLLCKAMVSENGSTAYRFTNGGDFSTSRSLDCREEPSGPLSPRQLPVVRTPPDSQFDAVFLKTLPENCTRRSEVTRWRHGFRYVLSILGRCTITIPKLTEKGVRVGDPDFGTATADDLWRFAVDGWERWPRHPNLTSPVTSAEIAFNGCPAAGCTLVIHGQAPTDLVVRIGGAEVPVVPGPTTVRIPVNAAQASTPDGVWLTLSRRSGERLGMRLTGLSLEKSTEGHS
jgi:hypothetical protein